MSDYPVAKPAPSPGGLYDWAMSGEWFGPGAPPYPAAQRTASSMGGQMFGRWLRGGRYKREECFVWHHCSSLKAVLIEDENAHARRFGGCGENGLG